MRRQYVWIFALVLILGGFSVFWLARNATSGDQPYQGTELDGIAPDFRLTDQNGTFVGLSDFRGKVVVLTFMDSKCKDTCPLTAADFRKAYRHLGADETSQVVFLGVNVNVQANTTADVLETTHEWQLDKIPNWHFLTGSREELGPVWKDYAISVMPGPDGTEISHTPGVFLIDPSGQKRWYLSMPFPADENDGSALPMSELLLEHIRDILAE